MDPVRSRSFPSSDTTFPMHIPLYTGQAAQAARLAIMWRRCATQTVILWRVSADMAESANLFRMARAIWEGSL